MELKSTRNWVQMESIKQLKLINPSFSFPEIKQELDLLLNEKLLQRAIRWVFGFLVFDLLLVVSLWSNLPPEVPLFYSRPWGQEQLAQKLWLFFLPFICFLVTIINFRLASLFYKKEPFLAKIFVWTSFIIAFLVSINIIRILLIIT